MTPSIGYGGIVFAACDDPQSVNYVVQAELTALRLVLRSTQTPTTAEFSMLRAPAGLWLVARNYFKFHFVGWRLMTPIMLFSSSIAVAFS